MNRDHILFQLREAEEELARTIAELERRDDYDAEKFSVAMEHLYYHLNTAWNTRSEPPDRISAFSDEDFQRWRQFPRDLPLGE
jgi:hypothetical protein